MRNKKQLISKLFLIVISIGFCLYYTYWVVIMFVNFKYELTNTVIYKSHYGVIIQHVTFAMYCVAMFSPVNLWFRHCMHKNVNRKKIDIALLVTESALICIVLSLIPFFKRDIAGIAFSTEYLDHIAVDYFLLYVPYLIFWLLSYRYWKTRKDKKCV